MAITASSISADNTLDEFRVQFNNLVIDVDGISSLSAFGESITFDGATAGGSKTTVTVVDPTASNIITLPNTTGTVITTANSADPSTESTGSNVSHVLVDVGGTLKKITRGNLGIGGAVSADDITGGDSAVNITTDTGNITIDAAANDSDIIFKGTDASADITMLTLDGSEAGLAIFNSGIRLADGATIGVASSTSAITIASTGIVTFVDDILLKNDGTIGSAGAAAAMTIDSNGIVAFVDDIKIKDDGTIGSATTAGAITIASGGAVTLSNGLIVADGGSIGSASDTNAITISSGGDVALTGGGLSLIDGEEIVLGTNSDVAIEYDESATDSLVFAAKTNDAALGVVFQADDGADAADKWKMGFANGGTFTFGNDIASQNTFVTMLTITPHATASSATMAFTGSITAAGSTLKAVGKETIYVPATAMYPNTTNGSSALTQVELATDGSRPELKVLDFDKDSDEFAQFSVAFPKSYNGDHVSFRVFWIGNASTDGVAWALQGLSAGDNAEADAAFGTAVVVQDDSQGDATEVLVTSESGNVTLSGEGDDKMTFFQIYRDVSDGNDDMSADARLVGIQLFYTSDLANDA